MTIISRLRNIWKEVDYPFLLQPSGKNLCFQKLGTVYIEGIEKIKQGDVVALIGDFDPESIATLLHLIEKGAIVVPLTSETQEQHEYFIKESYAQHVFNKNVLINEVATAQPSHPLLDEIRQRHHPGLILFTSGTTGRPKAILHDFIPFIERYGTPRPPLRAVAFLLFDHIGGINTILHMLFNQGQVVSLTRRTVESVIEAINQYSVELLPTTPTFLRMMSLYHDIENRISSSLKIISYGTERMDQPTLDRLCGQFPSVDFRQTYGMSELGILRIKSRSRNSLYMKVGGEGVETKTIDNILFIRSKNRMLGYLNAESPFDPEGWYCTKDIVKSDDCGNITIVGRDNDVINIGGLKFMPSEVERVCLQYPWVKNVKAIGRDNPITGQYLELIVEFQNHVDSEQWKNSLAELLRDSLPRFMYPSKITVMSVNLSHRFKKL
jgi:long-chain acyl-CoA synthetase